MDSVQIYKPGTVPANVTDSVFGSIRVNFVNFLYKPGQSRDELPSLDVTLRNIRPLPAKQRKTILASAKEQKTKRNQERVDGSFLPAVFEELRNKSSDGDIRVTYASVVDDAKLAGRHDAAKTKTIRTAEESSVFYKMKIEKRKHDGFLGWIDHEANKSFMTDADTIKRKARSMLVTGRVSQLPFMMHVWYNGTIRVSLGEGKDVTLAQLSGTFKEATERAAQKLVAWVVSMAARPLDGAVPIKTVAVSTQSQLRSPYWFGPVGTRGDADMWRKRLDLGKLLTRKLFHTRYGSGPVGSIETLTLPRTDSNVTMQKLRKKLRESYAYDDPNLPYDPSKLQGINEEKRATLPLSMAGEFDRREARMKELIKALSNSERDVYEYLRRRTKTSVQNAAYNHLKSTGNAVEPVESKLLREIDRWKFNIRLLALPKKVFDFARYEYSAEGNLVMHDVSFKPDADGRLVQEVHANIFGETEQVARTENPPTDPTNFNAMMDYARSLRPNAAKKRLAFNRVELSFKPDGYTVLSFTGPDQMKANEPAPPYVTTISPKDAATGLSVTSLTDVEATIPFWWTTGTLVTTGGGKDPWKNVAVSWEVLAAVFARKGPRNYPPVLALGKPMPAPAPVAAKQRAGRKQGTTCKPQERVPGADGTCTGDRFAMPNDHGDLCCFAKPKNMTSEKIRDVIAAYQKHALKIPPAVLTMLGLANQPAPQNAPQGSQRSEAKLSFDDKGRVKIDKRLAIRTPVAEVESVAKAYGIPVSYGGKPLSREDIASLMARKMLANSQALPESRSNAFLNGLYSHLRMNRGNLNFKKAYESALADVGKGKHPFVQS